MPRTRLIRWALWLWPSDLRARHGRSLEQTADAAWTRTATQPFTVRVSRRAALLVDLVGAGLAERWSARSARTSPMNTITSACAEAVRAVRPALRSLRRQPGYALVAVLTLALGVGANTAMFSIANPMLLRPLPYADADRLTAVIPAKRASPAISTHASYAAFKDWNQAARSFESLAAYGTAGSTYRTSAGASLVASTAVTGTLFEVLRSTPALGRVLTPLDDEPGAPPVVVVGDAFWRSALDARRDVIGATVELDGTIYTIVGVMPATFNFPHAAPPTDVWIPVTQYQPFAPLLKVRAAPFLDVVGRLANGRTLADAQAEMTTIATSVARTYPATDGDSVATVVSLKTEVLGDTRPTLIMLGGAVAVLLLIACANVANLQLTRASARVREFAVRSALGASRARLMIQVFVEGLVLAAIGGAAGLFVAGGCLALLRGLLGADLPPVRAIGIDRAALVFTFAVAALTGLVFAAIPAFLSTGAGLQVHLAAGSRGTTTDRRRSLTHGAIVVAEIALALVLLTDASLLVRSLARLHDVRTGVTATNLWAATVTWPQDTYRTPAQWRSLARELRARLEQQPGVESVGFGVGVPLTSPAVRVPIAVAGMPVSEAATKPTTDLVEAGTTYFSTIGIPLLRGRPFSDADRDTAPTVGIVNATFVRRFLDSSRDPVGQHVRLGAKAAPLEIVGVVGDTAQSSISTPTPPVLYLAFDQRPFWVVTFAIRTRGAGVPVANVFHSAVASLAPAAPVVSVDSVQSLIDHTTAPSNHRTLVVGLLGVLALVLSGVGIYGIVAYSVAQRTREVGVRLALGAEPGGIRRLVLTQGTRLAAIGIGLGLLLSRLTMPLLSALLFQVTTTDPVTLVAGPAILALTAIAACYVPARRATRIDPIVALRSE